MISSSFTPTLVVLHQCQSLVWCRGQRSERIDDIVLVSHVIDFPLDDVIVELIDDVEDTNVVFDV